MFNYANYFKLPTIFRPSMKEKEHVLKLMYFTYE